MIRPTEGGGHIHTAQAEGRRFIINSRWADDNNVYVLLPNDDRPVFTRTFESGLLGDRTHACDLMSGTQIMAQFLPVGRAVYAMVTACVACPRASQCATSTRKRVPRSLLDYPTRRTRSAKSRASLRWGCGMTRPDGGRIDLFDFGREHSAPHSFRECHLDCELKLGDVLNNLRVVKFDDGPKEAHTAACFGGKDWQNKEPELKKMRKMRKMWKDEDRQGNPKAKKRMRKLDQQIFGEGRCD